MQSNCTVRQTSIGKEREIIEDGPQIDGKKENSSGTEEIFERAPDGVVASCRGRPPTAADEAEGVVGNLALGAS